MKFMNKHYIQFMSVNYQCCSRGNSVTSLVNVKLAIPHCFIGCITFHGQCLHTSCRSCTPSCRSCSDYLTEKYRTTLQTTFGRIAGNFSFASIRRQVTVCMTACDSKFSFDLMTWRPQERWRPFGSAGRSPSSVAIGLCGEWPPNRQRSTRLPPPGPQRRRHRLPVPQPLREASPVEVKVEEIGEHDKRFRQWRGKDGKFPIWCQIFG